MTVVAVQLTSWESQMERKWPSLKEQLNAVKAPASSALEQLIKDNQDVHLLHASEVQDDWDYPLWLRVYFRKITPAFRSQP